MITAPRLLRLLALSALAAASAAFAADLTTWPSQYTIRPWETAKLTPADVVGPDGIVYPDFTGVGVTGGIPDINDPAVRDTYTIFNVKDYGALGNNSADDDVAVANAASAARAHLDANAANKAILYFPAGTYLLSNPIVFSQSNVVIDGDGPASTILKIVTDTSITSGALLTLKKPIGWTAYVPAAANISRGSNTATFSLDLVANGYTVGSWVRIQATVSGAGTTMSDRFSNPDNNMVYTKPIEHTGRTFFAKVTVLNNTTRTLTFDRTFTHDYFLDETPQLRRMPALVEYGGIQDLAIETLAATATIEPFTIENAANCWIKNIKSTKARNWPFIVINATRIEVRDSQFLGTWVNIDSGNNAYLGWSQNCTDSLMDNVQGSDLRHMAIFQQSNRCVIRNSSFTGQSVTSPQLHGNFPHDNLIETTTFDTVRPGGTSTQGLSAYWSDGASTLRHGVAGPRNVFYNNRINSGMGTVMLNGIMEGLVFAYNRVLKTNDTEGRSGFNITDRSFDGIVRGNIFQTFTSVPFLSLEDPTCTGWSVTDNKIYGSNGYLYEGDSEPALNHNNRFFSAATTPDATTTPEVASLYDWQRTYANTARLVLVIDRRTVTDTGGTTSATVVRVKSSTDSALTVNLSANPAGLSVPATVTIPAGAVSTTFTVTGASVTGGEKLVTLTAAASGLLNDVETVAVLDQDVAQPDFGGYKWPVYPAGLPTNWKAGNYGQVSVDGTQTYTPATDTWSITGGGVDTWPTHSSLARSGRRFLYQTIDGDGEIRARITAASGEARVGLMIADDEATVTDFIFVEPTGRVYTSSNTLESPHGAPIGHSGAGTKVVPQWLRLKRTGFVLIASKSTVASPASEADWTQIASVNMYQNNGFDNKSPAVLDQRMHYGMFIISGSATTAASATFTGVALTGNVVPTTPPPVTAPAAPTSLTATPASATQLNLTWADNASNETGFKLERSANGTTGWSQIAAPAANSTSYADTGLTASTTYHYRVRATNGSSDSAYSNSANATTSPSGGGTNQSQSITFAALPAKVVTDPDFTLSATASSGLTVSYSSSNTAVATVSGNTVNILTAGTTTITASQSGDATYAAATPVPQTLTVSQATQTITFAPLASVIATDADFTLTGSASSGLPVSYVSSDTAVATVSGNIVNVHAAGSTVITASQSGDATYSAATNVPQTLTVNPAAVASAVMVYEPFNYSPTSTNPDPDGAGIANGGNGLPATNVGGMPADTSTGLRGNYGADQTVVAGLTYSDANGTLTTSANALRRTSGTNWSAGAVWLYRFMNVDPFAAYRSGASTNWFGWNASSGPRELYFSVLLSASSLNTGADNRLILMLGRDNVQHNVYLGQNTGSVWRVTDSGTTNLTLGSAVANQTVLVVGRLAFNSATQFVTDYWFNPALGAALGAPAASLTYTTTTSGGQFLGLQTRDGANILTIDEFRLGTTYAAVTPYSSLPSAPVALAASVASASQLNLTWIDTAANETGFKIERSANGTTGWTQIAAPAANATSYSDSGLSAATTYYYRVLATNAAGDSAASASASATTLQLAQSISFAALPDKLVTDAAFALTATASSGLPVSYVSTDPAVATVSGNTVTIVGAGTTTITASQSGNTTYSAATNVSQALTVNKVGQAITFGALASRTYGGASFTLTGSASSGLPVSYVSSNPSVANVSGSTVTLYTAGTTVITAAQSGDATYSAAASVPQTLTVNKATQSITFPAIPTKTPTSPAFALTATASSGLPVSYVSSNLSVATVEGATVTIEGSGTSTFTASQAGDANYLPAANATQVLTVNPALVIIHERFNYTVGSTNPDPDDNGNANFGNGLPANNIGGTPSGVSTGLRSSWGTTTTVVTGLSYTRNGKTLVTSGAAGRVNKTGWGGQPFIYRSMSADPFLANRIGGVNTGNLGVPGSSLYVSLLAQTSSATADAFRLSFKHDGSANLYLTNTATGWAINNGSGNIVAAGAPLALSTPTLLVLRFDFAASSTAVSLWVNPVLGDPLGTPAATITSMFFPGLSNLQTRPSVANAMTFDELRIGQDLSAVTPFTSP